MSDGKKVKVTQIKSLEGRNPRQRATIRGLGLRRLHKPVVLIDTPEVRGMINKVSFMLRVEEA
jgi:large subunit ribosomal protein L30